MHESAIVVSGLRKHYDDVVAVDGLDLRVRRGECFGLLGPNGAGKTTTIEILEGLVAPTSGDARALREKVGVCLQESQLVANLTVEETVEMFRSFYDRGLAIDDAIARVQLEEKRSTWVGKLSGGQRQRLALACGMIGDPELLFLDEPSTGLDPQSRRAIWDVLADLQRSDHTIVLSTHYMDEAERLCDRVAIVDHGKIIALGSPRELIAATGAEELVEFATDPAIDPASLADLPAVTTVTPSGSGLVLACGSVHVALPALFARLEREAYKLTRLSTRPATLEDTFVALTGRRLRDG
jgi:ABC-2 type transport system ATP-binding protein